jgi:hypothetical protein
VYVAPSVLLFFLCCAFIVPTALGNVRGGSAVLLRGKEVRTPFLLRGSGAPIPRARARAFTIHMHALHAREGAG